MLAMIEAARFNGFGIPNILEHVMLETKLKSIQQEATEEQAKFEEIPKASKSKPSCVRRDQQAESCPEA